MTKLIGLLRRIGGGLVAACLIAAVGSVSAVWAWSQAGNFTVGGNVGIGTESPAETMEIKNNKPVLSIHEPGVATFKIGSDGGAFKLAAMDNGYGGHTGNFDDNDTQILSMSTSGNVGIGTTSPEETMEIRNNKPVLSIHEPGVATFKIGSDGGAFKLAAMDNGYGGHTGNFDANDTQILSMSTSGNVGIGTTSPEETMEIRNNKPVLSIHEPGVATFKIGSDGGAFKLAAMDNGYGGHTGNFDDNDTQILSMSTSGKVGIGTTSPSQKLDVVGNSSGNDGITVSNPGSGNPQIRWLNDTGVQKYAITSFDHDGSYTVAHWVAGAGNTLNITQNGNVGIGTESPAETMEIKNNKPVLSIHEPGVATFKIGSDGGAFKLAAMDNGYGGHTGNFDANDTQILSMSTNGNVGIGTTSPQTKLDVAGDMRVSGDIKTTGDICIGRCAQ